MSKNSIKKQRFPWMMSGLIALACGAGFAAGWLIKTDKSYSPAPLRLSGYQFTSPLLTCNYAAAGVVPENAALKNTVQSLIDVHKSAGDISKASAYFTDFITNKWIEAYPSDKYYPSSLGKIPILMAYYKVAEAAPEILQKKILFPAGSPDLNATEDIKPLHALAPGSSYSVDELLGFMIKYSENNAAQLLYDNIDQSVLRNVYGDLQIPVNEKATIANLDFITPRQIGALFRILYNATYLSHDYSEKALALLSQSSFMDGLAAGVSRTTPVAHKFGIVGIAPAGGAATEHELHDCGIVYAPNHPYLLCVMTRGPADLSRLERTIADISATVAKTLQ